MMVRLFAAWFALSGFLSLLASEGARVETLAGSGKPERIDGENTAAAFQHPFGICADADGNVFVADSGNHSIRKVTPEGRVSTFAGTGEKGTVDGAASSARFDTPSGLCFHANGDLYVCSYVENTIRIVGKDGRVTSLIARRDPGYRDGPVASASIFAPRGLAFDRRGNLFFSDCWNHRIRKITPDGVVSTFAGGGPTGIEAKAEWRDGKGTDARFYAPCGLAIDDKDNLYVADAENHRVRKITPDGVVTTIAGSGPSGKPGRAFADGPAATSRLNTPTEVFIVSDGTVYFSDTYGNRVREISRSGIVSTIAEAGFDLPRGLAIHDGTAFVADFNRHTIRRFALARQTGATQAVDREGVTFFESKIRPVLVTECQKCHSEEAAKKGKLKGQLAVDSKTALLRGGESGPAIVPGKPSESLLLAALRHESLEMPPRKKLPDHVVADFERWIAIGAPDPRDGRAVDLRSLALAGARDHWSFRPLRKGDPPEIDDPWIRNPVDRFILAKLRDEKMAPTGEADRRTLARRLSLDLLGLPADLETVEAFVRDESSDAYERLVDRLLESPHFGERQGRHWLDVARFGESEGSNPEEDRPRRDAYKYRDAVIRAFHEDLPFDRFVSYQIAGRDIESDSPLAKDLARFVDLGTRIQRNSHPNDKKFHILDDMVSATGSAFLALTVECARCHDHKLDPITTEEYYRLTAVFFDRANVSNRVGVNAVELFREPYLLAGGSWHSPVRKVNPGFVEVLMREKRRSESWIEAAKNRGPREALADWLTDVDRGAGTLLARVIVNRLWQHHFGRGIVATPNDFGRLGEEPSHPELLDWLANELVRGDWRLKPIHRLMLTSSSYRQASSDRWATRDQDNRLVWHYRTRRLEAEAIRDAILSVSGTLRRDLFGPSIDIGSARKAYSERPSHWRRSLYLMNPRFVEHPVLEVFDPVGNFRSQAKRAVSTTPNGALFLLNAPFVRTQAKRLAERVTKEAGSEVSERVELLYRLAFARPPSQEEEALGIEFLRGGSTDESLVDYCQAIFGLSEFLYIP